MNITMEINLISAMRNCMVTDTGGHLAIVCNMIHMYKVKVMVYSLDFNH